MSGETSNPQSERDLYQDQLIAYLDGELAPEAAESLERRLSEDPDLRKRLQRHQQTWDLLDDIPRAEVNERFTQTTVEMVAVSTEGDIRDIRRGQDMQRRFFWFAGIAGVTIACVVGYAGMSFFLAAPDRQLIKDLPIIEDLDAYRNAESVDFLKTLESEGLFVAELDNDI